MFALVLLNCSSSKLFQEQVPFEFGEVYYETWTGGIQEAGSGIDLYISITSNEAQTVVIDKIYFRGKSVLPEVKKQGQFIIYVGRYKSKTGPKEKMTYHSSKMEAAIEDLKANECIVSYKENGEIKYYKIDNIKEKRRIDYPETPPNH